MAIWCASSTTRQDRTEFDGDIETSFSSGNSKTFKVLLRLLTYCYGSPQDGKEIVKGRQYSHLLPLMMKPREQLQDLFKNAKQKKLSNYKELQELFEEKLKETVIQMMAPDCPFHTNNKSPTASSAAELVAVVMSKSITFRRYE